MTQIVFKTSRIIARRLESKDLAALLAVYGDADAMRWVGDGKPLSEAECRKWLDVTSNNYRLRGYGMFALTDRADGGVLGFCGLVHPGGQPEPEVKYAFGREHWGRGLATEAVRALLAYGARVHSLRRVIATIAPENEASRRVLIKAGLCAAEPRINSNETSTDVFVWHAPNEDEF